MSGLEQTQELLESDFKTRWGTTTPVQYVNAEKRFAEPKDVPWVRFAILFGDTRNTSICNDGISYRQSGTVQVYISVPTNQGSKEALKLADKFRTMYANKQIGIVSFRTGYIAPPENRANWFRVRVSIPFWYNTK